MKPMLTFMFDRVEVSIINRERIFCQQGIYRVKAILNIVLKKSRIILFRR